MRVDGRCPTKMAPCQNGPTVTILNAEKDQQDDWKILQDVIEDDKRVN